jgi:hypothetical protein
MSQFKLAELTTAKVLEVDVLSDKDRAPDANPGAALNVSMTHSNNLLTMFDGFLRGMFYRAVDANPDPKQDRLEGIPAKENDTSTDMPKLTEIGMHIREVNWELELVGYQLYIDYGTAGPSAINLTECKLSNFKFQMKEGGSIISKFRIEAPDVGWEVHGKLAMLKSQEIKMTLTAPVVQSDDDVATVENTLPFGHKDHKGDTEMLTPEKALAAANDAIKPGKASKKA